MPPLPMPMSAATMPSADAPPMRRCADAASDAPDAGRRRHLITPTPLATFV